MSSAALHYIYDPFCGWCYGAAPLVKAARAVLPVVAHGGGMMAGPARRPVTPQLRQFVMPHDQRIAQLTGQTFGEAYFEGLLRDLTAVFDSERPIGAVLAAEEIAGRGLDLLERLQIAHYVEGRRIADVAVLAELAGQLGMDRETFAAVFDRIITGKEAIAHIEQSRALLARAGGQGFPTFVLERGGRFERIESSSYYGRADAWQTWLEKATALSPAPQAAAGQSPAA